MANPISWTSHSASSPRRQATKSPAEPDLARSGACARRKGRKVPDHAVANLTLSTTAAGPGSARSLTICSTGSAACGLRQERTGRPGGPADWDGRGCPAQDQLIDGRPHLVILKAADAGSGAELETSDWPSRHRRIQVCG
jgi:hypothetical protein